MKGPAVACTVGVEEHNCHYSAELVVSALSWAAAVTVAGGAKLTTNN